MRISDTEESLLDAVRRELRLTGFRSGVHKSEDEHGMKKEGSRVRALWVAVVAPSFDPHGAVAVLDTGSGRRFGAALGTEHRAPLGMMEGLVTESFELPADWLDPVPPALGALDFDTDQGLTLDGIGYRLIVARQMVDAEFSFFNPTTPGLMRLEAAIHAALSSAADQSGSERLREFATTAARYAASRSGAQQ